MLRAVGFERVTVTVKPESRDTIKTWLPGSNAEDYVVSADIVAFKPITAGSTKNEPRAAERSQPESQPDANAGCCSTATAPDAEVPVHPEVKKLLAE